MEVIENNVYQENISVSLEDIQKLKNKDYSTSTLKDINNMEKVNQDNKTSLSNKEEEGIIENYKTSSNVETNFIVSSSIKKRYSQEKHSNDIYLPSRINTKITLENENHSVKPSLLSPTNSNYDYLSEASPMISTPHTPFYQTNLCNEGDERADAVVEMLKIKPYQDALSIIIRHVVSRRTWSSQLEYKQHLLAKEFHELVCEIPSWVDWDRIDHGQKVFWRYSWPLWISCIGSAMTRGATLPIPSPNDGKTPNQRLLETSQFLLECMFPDSLKPGNFGWSTAIRIRCAHSLSRTLYYRNLRKEKNKIDININENNDESSINRPGNANTDLNTEKKEFQEMLPVSQADLIRTILYISLGSVSAMKRGFGIRMEKDEKEDYVLLWRYIAWLCGVENQNNPLISLREGETSTNQLIAAESCMFLDDEAVKFTSAMLQAMASIIPIFGRSMFVRALTNEMAGRLMGNEVVTNMKLKPKSNETHRQILKWFIQCCRLSCRVVAKNSFGKTLLCTLNRMVVPKMVWLANGGKWVDYSRGCYSGVKDPIEEEYTSSSKRSSVLSERDDNTSPTNSINFELNSLNRRRRRSQVQSMDSTLLNEFNEGAYTYGGGSDCGSGETEEEEWVQKPPSTYSMLIQHSRRRSHGRPQSWSNESARTILSEGASAIGLSNLAEDQDSPSSQTIKNHNHSQSLSRKFILNESKNPFSTKKGNYDHTHWLEKIARINMWAVVPAMSVAMAAYCVVLVYID